MSCLGVRLINERLFSTDNLLSSVLLCKTGHLKDPSAAVEWDNLGEKDVLWFYGTHGRSPCNWGFSHHLHTRWSWMAPLVSGSNILLGLCKIFSIVYRRWYNPQKAFQILVTKIVWRFHIAAKLLSETCGVVWLWDWVLLTVLDLKWINNTYPF